MIDSLQHIVSTNYKLITSANIIYIYALTNSSSFSHSSFSVKLRTFLALISPKYKRHRYEL